MGLKDLTSGRRSSRDGNCGAAFDRYLRLCACGSVVFVALLLSSQAHAGSKKPLPAQAAAQAKANQAQKQSSPAPQSSQSQFAQPGNAFTQPSNASSGFGYNNASGPEDNGNGKGKGNGLGPNHPQTGEGPPRTLVELFKRMIAPRSKATAEKARDAAAVAGKGDGSEKDKQSNSKPSAKRPPGSPIASTDSSSSIKIGEVVAVNLSDAGRGRAEALGFRVLSSSFISSLGANVTRLRTPPGIDARAARQLLEHESPADSFAFNKVYRLSGEVHGTTLSSRTDDELGEHGSPMRQHIDRKAQTSKSACEEDHCFARSVIHWQNELAACSSGLRVGILDTGIDLPHPAFRGQDIVSGSFIPIHSLRAPNDHATAVMSILAGAPNSSTPGLIPDAKFFSANIFYLDRDAVPATDSVTLLAALDWMERLDVRLINMSFTGPEDALVHQALKRLASKRITLVAAGGNQGPASPPLYPAAYPEVVAVTAVDKRLRNYRRANRGAHIDVAAPGVGIWTAYPNGREGYQSGTSFAAPYVTALMATIYRTNKDVGAPEQMISSLPIRDLGSPGRDPVYGRGLVEAPSDCKGGAQPPDLVAETSTHLRRGKAGSSWALEAPVELSSWQPWRPSNAVAPAVSFSLKEDN